MGAGRDRLARVAARARWARDERDLLVRVGDSIRLQILHTLDYRRALANPSSADERRRGREVSRTIARDVPLARDLAANLLETADRLSAGRDATPAPAAPPPHARRPPRRPLPRSPLPPRGARAFETLAANPPRSGRGGGADRRAQL